MNYVTVIATQKLNKRPSKVELYAKVASHSLTALKMCSKCSFIPVKLRFFAHFRLVVKRVRLLQSRAGNKQINAKAPGRKEEHSPFASLRSFLLFLVAALLRYAFRGHPLYLNAIASIHRVGESPSQSHPTICRGADSWCPRYGRNRVRKAHRVRSDARREALNP